MGWATFWAIFSQTHLVTLDTRNRDIFCSFIYIFERLECCEWAVRLTFDFDEFTFRTEYIHIHFGKDVKI
jgi:hypothetical protein